MSYRWISASLVCALLAASMFGQFRNQRASGNPEFAYYLLVLSYAPDFCDQPTGRKDPRECGSGRGLGFVVHGLWPQGENSRGPEDCGSARPVSQAIVRAMLNFIPSESLIQHEWKTHGTCSGLDSNEYFAAVRKARQSVKIPPALVEPQRKLQLSPSQLEADFAAANPAFPRSAFRTSCYRDGELQEIRVCLSKDLSPQACGSSAGECRLDRVTVLPVR